MRALLKPSVFSRMMAVLGIAVATTALTGWIGSSGMRRTEQSLDIMLQHITALDLVKQAQILVLRSVIGEHETFRAADEVEQNKRADAALVTVAQVSATLESAENIILVQAARDKAHAIRESIPAWRTALEKVVKGGDGDVIVLLADADAKAVAIEAALTELTQMKREVATVAVDTSRLAGRESRRNVVLTAIFGSIICLSIATVIVRGIIKPLRAAIDVLQSVAKGDFTRRLELNRRDELGKMADALNGAIEGMHRALHDVRESASAVAVASRELSSAGDQISAGAQAQASSLEETSASLAEMTSTVKQNADNAQQASQVAKNARNVAELGGKVVSSAVSAMAEINASSKRIVDIITAIDEIAFQTNLLALNAAVEAARAGEQGRGFAVVAGEVRSLAQRSATSAKEIKSLIKDSVTKVENGSTLVHRSGETLREIVVAVERMSVIVDEIAAASREQSSGIDQLNRAVGQMDNVTQSNAAQTEELAGTAQSMYGQAEQLQDLVSRFKLRDNDGPARGQAHDRTYEARYVERSASARRGASASNGAVHQAHEDDETLDLGVLPETTRDNRGERDFLEF